MFINKSNLRTRPEDRQPKKTRLFLKGTIITPVAKKERQRRRREIFAWTLYDFANTAYSVIVVTVVFAIYFKQYIVADFRISFMGFERNPGDFFWGLGVAVSMLVVGLSSPITGAAADYSNRKKYFLFIYSTVCIIATILLYTLQSGMIWQSVLLFIIGNVGFEGAIVFYNGFLPQISQPDNIGKISGYGFALGYVGSLFSLLIALPYANLAINDLTRMRPTFIWAGIFFLTFSLPFYFLVKEKITSVNSGSKNLLVNGYQRTKKTIKQIRKFPEITKFLLSYFIYIDGVNTVIFFSGIYASDTLGFTMSETLQFFAIVQASAISGAFIFGFLTDKLGPRKTIQLTLILWMLVIVGASLSYNAQTFYLVGLVAGISMGSSQAASRAMMGVLMPEGMEAEFYGFYALTGKFSAILGPLSFGFISMISGSQRLAVLSLLLFLITGYILLSRVDESITYKKVVI